jgi:hypothetical protein
MSNRKRLRFVTLLAGSGLLSLAGIVSAALSTPSTIPERSIVWVYYTSLCEKPLDTSNCRQIPQPVRPAFNSLEACSAYREADLAAARNPRLLGSCLKQREA